MPVSVTAKVTYFPGFRGECCSLDGQFSALRHGITGIHRQVQNDLIDLIFIGLHQAQRRSRNKDNFDVLA